ncbi:SDR family oxidoreductase [Phenylobacterium sp.]|uniref:SDR family oxidoreductase n=1 Tax=Phenylobacterium sp. TaxID=1871053 RepID=UPI0025D3FC5D|nr:SDR family oxidoreductase [Phenylobacterium sp.]
MGRLEGKGAVVLGAAGRDNMGQVIARRFAEEGAKVLVAGRREDELARFAGEIGGHWALCDITRRDDVFALAETAKSRLGGVQIGVNATGWGLLKPFLENSEAELKAMSDLQFVGPIFFLQAMIGAMDQGGSLIQISSATATIMLNDHAAYMGTKAGTDHVVRCVANEFGARGIRANSISPGLTDTPMTAGAKQTPGVFAAFASAYPLGRVGTSDDIAAAAVWLASDECFMTGQNLQVNGGLTLRRNPTGDEITASVIAAMAAK